MDAAAHELIEVPPAGSPDRQALYDQCIQARIAVFVDEQGFPLETELDAQVAEDIATHILLRLVPSGTPAGTVRIHKPPGAAAYYKLTRLVVLPAHRKHHFGAALVRRAHQWAVEDHVRSGAAAAAAGEAGPGVVMVVVHAQIPVKPFYAKLGYVPEGDEFDEEGAPHQKMVARLPVQI